MIFIPRRFSIAMLPPPEPGGNASIASIAKRATADLERVAHDITAPIQAVGAEEPTAAGVGSHQHRPAA
jgi:hypothetical protein